ncbi:hypothetical protein [Haloactinopolyspora alba]
MITPAPTPARRHPRPGRDAASAVRRSRCSRAGLALMYGILDGFLQGTALLTAAGVDAAAFTPVASGGLATVASWLPGYARQIDEGAYAAADSTMDTHLAAIDHLVHESESLGVSTEFPRFVKALADRAIADGHGGNGYPALIEQFRKPAGDRP